MSAENDSGKFLTIAPTTGEFDLLSDCRRAIEDYVAWKEGGCSDSVPQTYLGNLVDEERRTVIRGNARVGLNAHDFPWQTFLLLWRRTTAYVKPAELISVGWDDSALAIDDNVQYHISILRKLLLPLGLHVRNERGVGYRLEKNPLVGRTCG